MSQVNDGIVYSWPNARTCEVPVPTESLSEFVRELLANDRGLVLIIAAEDRFYGDDCRPEKITVTVTLSGSREKARLEQFMRQAVSA